MLVTWEGTGPIRKTTFFMLRWQASFRTQCYKTFYDCKLPMYVISSSVCPCKAFPVECLRVWQEPTQVSTVQVLHSRVGFWPFPQLWLEKPARDEHPSLLIACVNYGRIKVYTVGTRCQCDKKRLFLCQWWWDKSWREWLSPRNNYLVLCINLIKANSLGYDFGWIQPNFQMLL